MNTLKPVLCANTGELFPSSVAACRKFGFTEARLSAHLTGRCRTCGGKVFVRLSGTESDAEIERLRKDALKRVYGIEV